MTNVSFYFVRVLALFFFSSRRRQTRYWRDWSSDVCSSDLVRAGGNGLGFEPAGLTWGEGQRLRSGLPGQAVMAAPPLVEELREVKDERELTAMREAARIGGEAL